MRRLKILYYWLVRAKNNVTLAELLSFLVKPTTKRIANQFIENVERSGPDYEISFKNIKRHLFWPANFSIEGAYQVVAETFDKNDWHYYQKPFSEVTANEVIVDVGTAEGLFILDVVDRCKKAILIEPNGLFVNALKRSLADSLDKITIHNVAVGAEQKQISFSSTSLSSKVDASEKNAIKVNMETVDRLVSNEPVITYLKADIEGFEIEMLKGAEKTIRKHRPKMVITTYHDENRADDIISLVKSYVPDYKFYKKGVFQYGGKPVMVHFW
jgi:FkbM family methyltransferase